MTLIAVLAGEGEDVKAAAGSSGEPAAAAQPHATPAKAAAPVKPARRRSSRRPRLRTSAPREPLAPRPAEGAQAPVSKDAGPTVGHGANRVFSSPLARRLAKEAGIEIARIPVRPAWPRRRARRGGGEIGQGARRLPPRPRAGAAAVAPQCPDRQILALFEPGSYEVVPHDGMRHDHRAPDCVECRPSRIST